MLTEDKVKAALSKVMDPDLNVDVVSLGMISAIKIEDGGKKVAFTLTLTTPACPVKEVMEQDCKNAVLALEGVETIDMISTAAVAGQRKSEKQEIPGVKQIIAVTSGKGGVGKSTVSVNLAVSLSKLGAKVGLLDADITGPNIPLMMGLESYEPQAKNDRIVPAESHGVKCISMAFFVSQDTPMIWRGPMLDKAIRQFLRDVEWGELDYLVVDMPPGTGDAQLSLVQSTDLAGGVIVTTPQDVALLDGRKGLSMFKQMNVPILGFVENMSYFQPKGSTEQYEIFGRGGGKRLAEEMKVPFLGELPLDPEVRIGGDNGAPITATDPDCAVSQAFLNIAKQVAAQISISALNRAAATAPAAAAAAV
jgi:ATP-binding protein involved in chromosome partitioning